MRATGTSFFKEEENAAFKEDTSISTVQLKTVSRLKKKKKLKNNVIKKVSEKGQKKSIDLKMEQEDNYTIQNEEMNS